MSLSKLDYCQYLLSSPVNYTLTNMADHVEELSHDRLNRYLRDEKLTPRLLWENVREVYTPSAHGYLVFDDTVLDKGFGPSIEMTRRQWSGNAHGIIRGIGLVSCIYVNPELEQFWVIDYRIFDPEGDGKTKIDHVEEMLQSVKAREIAFQTVLMDSWYATKRLMLFIDNWHQEGEETQNSSDKKLFYCPLKSNRRVDDSGGAAPYRAVCELEWSDAEQEAGKTIKIYGFPKDSKVQLFRVPVSSHRTDYVVTNDDSQSSTQDTRQVCAVRWKIEQYHREIKQLTGIESCQCRKARIQRNHVHCALLVWTRLKDLAYQNATNVYQLKHGLLRDYLVQQLKRPSLSMVSA